MGVLGNSQTPRERNGRHDTDLEGLSNFFVATFAELVIVFHLRMHIRAVRERGAGRKEETGKAAGI